MFLSKESNRARFGFVSVEEAITIACIYLSTYLYVETHIIYTYIYIYVYIYIYIYICIQHVHINKGTAKVGSSEIGTKTLTFSLPTEL